MAQQVQKDDRLHTLSVLQHLHSRAISATSPAELRFIIVNETVHLAPYRQAAFFDADGCNPRLQTASGLVSTEESSPYTVWINRFARQFDASKPYQLFDFAQASAEHQESWEEWLPEHLLLIPLKNPANKTLGYALYAREQLWQENEVQSMQVAHSTYQYCMSNLTGNLKSRKWLQRIFSRAGTLLVTACLVGAMFIPVRLSALAPAEVIALNALSVAAPQDGVIQSFAVEPNSEVKKGDLLFALDDTSITNRYAVAAKALAIAKADALVAEQRAFDELKGKADLASALGNVHAKEAELHAIEALKSRVEVRADRDGIAVFVDENDWIGRPVQTGERVMQIANPQDAGVLIWLPVQDALNLEPGAPIKLFLHTQPLKPIASKLQQTSYQATMSPSNVACYRLKGNFDDATTLPRIGLRGTARVSGEWSMLGYYLFRRPIAAFRAWSGI